jgi:hypothetical protein
MGVGIGGGDEGADELGRGHADELGRGHNLAPSPDPDPPEGESDPGNPARRSLESDRIDRI